MAAPWPGSYLDLLKQQAAAENAQSVISTPSTPAPNASAPAAQSAQQSPPAAVVQQVAKAAVAITMAATQAVAGVAQQATQAVAQTAQTAQQAVTQPKAKSGRATKPKKSRGHPPPPWARFFGRMSAPTRNASAMGQAIGRRVGWAIGSRHGKKNAAATARTAGVVGATILGTMGAIGTIAGAAVAGVMGLKLLHDQIVRMTDGAIASARKLAEVSGPMAAILAERDVQEIRRDMRQGSAQAGSVRNLVQSEQNRKTIAEPIVNAINNMNNNLLAMANVAIEKSVSWGAQALPLLMYFPGISLGVSNILGLAKSKNEGTATELDKAMIDLTQQVSKVNAQGKSLMDIARDAAKEGSGHVVPRGGMPQV